MIQWLSMDASRFSRNIVHFYAVHSPYRRAVGEGETARGEDVFVSCSHIGSIKAIEMHSVS